MTDKTIADRWGDSFFSFGCSVIILSAWEIDPTLILGLSCVAIGMSIWVAKGMMSNG